MTKSDEVAFAFPSDLRAEARVVLGHMTGATHPPVGVIGRVSVRGETLQIPHRQYAPPMSTPLGWQPLRHTILNCVYTRHNDGFVRERHLRRLLHEEAVWVAPFVVQLLGEYVLEIVQIIASVPDLAERRGY